MAGSEQTTEVLSIDGREVRVTNPDKLYFSREVQLTKLVRRLRWIMRDLT